jgi:hypothetical protein
MASTTRHDLSPDDAERLNRLSEEVRGRLFETALILGRVTRQGEGRGNAVTRFVPRARMHDEKKKAEGDWIEIIDVDGEEACYGVIDGQPFAESPCGAS